MKLGLIGFYGAGNLGDDLLLRSTLDLLKRESRKLHFETIKIFCNSESELKDFKDRELILVKKFAPWGLIKNLSDLDCLFFAGGSIFQDQTSLKSLLYYLFVILIAKFFNTKVVLISQGLGPLNLKVSRILVKNVFKLVDYASFRDLRSYRIAKNFFKAKKIFQSCDLVWSLDLEQFLASKVSKDLEETKIFISLRESKFLGETFLETLLNQELLPKKEKKNLKIDLLCLSKEDFSISEEFCDRLLRAGFKQEQIKIIDLSSLKNLESFLQSCLERRSQETFAFLTRFHALVLINLLAEKLNQPIKITGISYDPKVKSLCKMLGFEYFDLLSNQTKNHPLRKGLESRNSEEDFKRIEQIL